MNLEKQIKVVLFCGGRGSQTIATALNNHEQICLSLFVNAYDDGLSTGEIRRFIPGMLGPSDIRKNVRALMPVRELRHQALRELLGYRFADEIDREEAVHTLKSLARGTGFTANCDLQGLQQDLSVRQAGVIGGWCTHFLKYEEVQEMKGSHLNYRDSSLGNILFGGCFLEADCDFNEAVKTYVQFCEVQSSVLNITDGKNLVLSALKEDGHYLPDESSVVSPHKDKGKITELFLQDSYLSEEEINCLANQSKEERLEFLRNRNHTPQINPCALQEIYDAHIIIYGPGTQHSSLFPSYLTSGVVEAIVANAKAEKLFIANIQEDHDIQNQTVHELLNSFHFYMSRKAKIPVEIKHLITRVFIQDPDYSDINRDKAEGHIPFGDSSHLIEGQAVKRMDWEEKIGTHSGGQIVDELLGIVQQLVDIKVQPYRHKVSVVIPALNEVKTVQQVLRSVGQLDFSPLGVSKEIIFVDGGSTDGTLELAKLEKYTRVFTLGDKKGRGEAMKHGLSKSRGNIVVFFPADNEYEANDILQVVKPVFLNQFKAVIGSRSIKCSNINQRIRQIYGNDWLSYFLSKYGGILLSITTLFLYNRYVTDPLSTLKAFDKALLEDLNLKSSGLDLEMETIAKITLRGEYILEVPVQYKARSVMEGKKTTVVEGIKALFALFIWLKK